MERAARFAYDDTSRAKLDKLDALLAQNSTSREDAALIAEMLSLGNDGRYPELDLTSEQRRQRTLQALVSQLDALTRRNPVLVIFEDAHWIDPTSMEVLSRVADRTAGLPLLLILTFRPEFSPPWIGQPHVTAMTINRLTERQVGAMIERVVGNKALPTNIRRDIIERTDGIPLFVEEMTKAVLEAGTESEAQRIAASVPSPALAVPASLHASLMARLDRLGPAKEVAQVGAAIGREFSYALLASVARQPETKLESVLDRLVEAGLLFRRGQPPHATYLFKHALVQDAAYGTLLREPRRAIHARIVEALETRFSETVQSQPELLAHHCSEAGLADKAAALWATAGLRSMDRSAAVEAAAQLGRALGHLTALPNTAALRQQQIKLQVGLATSLMHTKGFAASETRAALEQARLLIERADALGEALEDELLRFSILYGSWVTNFVAFNSGAALEIAKRFLSMAEKRGTTVPVMIGHRLMGTSLLFTGDLRESRVHLDKAIALYDPLEHRALTTWFSQDMGVVAFSFRSWALWALGHADAALADADRAIRAARESGHAATLLYALSCVGLCHLYCRNYAVAAKMFEEAVALAEDKENVFWKALILLDRGYQLTLTGNFSDAVEVTTSAISLYRSTESVVHIPRAQAFLAWAYAELGQFEQAWQVLGEAIKSVEISNYRWWESETYRTAGEISRRMPEPDEAKAESYFESALAVARGQRAKSWELRTAMSMARLWRDQGKRKQAHDLLAPVYGWFTEGFDTLDLKEARSLLGELAS
jgi:predicted ATPase